MLEGLQTEFESLYLNNQVEFKYVGFSSENAKQNFAKKTENIHSRLCKLLEDKYTRAEAIELIDSLIKKLSSKIETLSEVNINDCDNLEISIYLQQNGKEFISLIEKNDIMNELAEYNNQTIAMVLSKILPSAIELEKEKNLSTDFCIVDTPYNTATFDKAKEGEPKNPKAVWTMQNMDWGDKWRYLSEEKIRQANERLSVALQELGYSDEKISKFLETDDSSSSSVGELEMALDILLAKKQKINKQTEDLKFEEIKRIEKEMDELRSSTILTEQDREDILKRKNALHLHKSIQLEKYKEQNKKTKKELESKIKNIKENLLYDKVYKSGCKIISTAKIFSAMYDDDSITPNAVMQYVDKDGLISDESLNSKYTDYKVTTVQEKDIANYIFPKDCYIIGKAVIGDGYGEHFVVIKSITSTVKNGNINFKYQKSNSSNNDEIRDYSSEEPGKDSTKARVVELRVFERCAK